MMVSGSMTWQMASDDLNMQTAMLLCRNLGSMSIGVRDRVVSADAFRQSLKSGLKRDRVEVSWGLGFRVIRGFKYLGLRASGWHRIWGYVGISDNL